MKILIICSGFYPEQSPRSFRATELAKELVRQGHNVKVATVKNEGHDDFEKETGVGIEHFSSKKPKKLSLKGSPIKYTLFRGINRALDLFLHYPNILFRKRVASYLLNTPEIHDVLISIAVPHPIHWGVASVWKKIKGKKAKMWIADCGDPFMYAAHDSFPKMPYFHWFENQLLKKADFVTVPFDEMKLLFNQKYSGKFRTIPQGFQFDNQNLPKYTPNDTKTFVYAGTVMPGHRDPFSLIDYLLEKNYAFRFIVYTRQHHHFKKYSNLLNSQIILKDYIPREDLLKNLAQADFLVNVNTDSKDGIINAIPTKLIDYRISGRPVLSYEQSKLPKETIVEFMKGNYQRAFVDEDFDRYRIENVAKKFINLADA